MSLLPRRDLSAVWAIKQHACPFSFHHNRLLPLLPAPTLHPPCILVQNIPTSPYCCYNGCVSPIFCWAGENRNTFCTQTNIQTICRDRHTDSHSIHTRITQTLAEHRGHNQRCVQIQVTAVLPTEFHFATHWQTMEKSWSESSTVFSTRDEQNEPCATSICLFLDSIDLCRSTANVR